MPIKTFFLPGAAAEAPPFPLLKEKNSGMIQLQYSMPFETAAGLKYQFRGKERGDSRVSGKR